MRGRDEAAPFAEFALPERATKMQQKWFTFVARAGSSQKNDRLGPFLSNYSCIPPSNGLNVSSTKIVLDSLQTGHGVNDASVAAARVNAETCPACCRCGSSELKHFGDCDAEAKRR